MKPTALFTATLLALGASTVLIAQPAPVPAAPAPAAAPAAPAAPTFTEEQILETFGWLVGRRMGLAELGFTAGNTEAIVKGVKLAAVGGEAPHNLDAIGPQLDAFMRAKETQYMAQVRAQTDAQSTAMLTDAAKQPGAQVLPSGVVYNVVQPGTGDFPKPTDQVTVHYTGRLPDGTVFDSSIERGQPAQFALNEVVEGWQEGIQKINKGGKLKLHIPAAKAYGDNPPPNSPIPPGAALAFDVELLDIASPAAPVVAPAPAPGTAPAPAPAPAN